MVRRNSLANKFHRVEIAFIWAFYFIGWTITLIKVSILCIRLRIWLELSQKHTKHISLRNNYSYEQHKGKLQIKNLEREKVTTVLSNRDGQILQLCKNILAGLANHTSTKLWLQPIMLWIYFDLQTRLTETVLIKLYNTLCPLMPQRLTETVLTKFYNTLCPPMPQRSVIPVIQVKSYYSFQDLTSRYETENL